MNQPIRQRRAVRAIPPPYTAPAFEDSSAGKWTLGFIAAAVLIASGAQMTDRTAEHARLFDDRMACAAHHQSFVIVNDGERDEVLCVGEGR